MVKTRSSANLEATDAHPDPVPGVINNNKEPETLSNDGGVEGEDEVDNKCGTGESITIPDTDHSAQNSERTEFFHPLDQQSDFSLPLTLARHAGTSSFGGSSISGESSGSSTGRKKTVRRKRLGMRLIGMSGFGNNFRRQSAPLVERLAVAAASASEPRLPPNLNKMDSEWKDELSVDLFASAVRTLVGEIRDESSEGGTIRNEILVSRVVSLEALHMAEVSRTKARTWCKHCEREASYACCWNASYCSEDCQKEDWEQGHGKTCRRRHCHHPTD